MTLDDLDIAIVHGEIRGWQSDLMMGRAPAPLPVRIGILFARVFARVALRPRERRVWQ